jgi:hypothetical protein
VTEWCSNRSRIAVGPLTHCYSRLSPAHVNWQGDGAASRRTWLDPTPLSLSPLPPTLPASACGRERAAPPLLRACAAVMRNVRAPAKSPSGGVQVYGAPLGSRASRGVAGHGKPAKCKRAFRVCAGK